MSRIGIMGGTFNPIHLGHLMLAECAREELQLEEVWFIPTGCSYMKERQDTTRQNMPSPEERLVMTRMAVQNVPEFRCMDIEVRREGYTYSYETLEELKKQCPENDFFFIFGADCLYTIENWKEPGRIFAACKIAAAVRGNVLIPEMQAKIAELQESYGADITLLKFRNVEISSTEIRERVRRNKSIRYIVPERVASYIEERGFYGE
jgi:nicotinate-nucleotide adenylyltransferase